MRQGYFVGGPRDGELVPFQAVGRKEWKCPALMTGGTCFLAFDELLDTSQTTDLEVVRYRGVCVVRQGPYIPVRETWFAAPGVSDHEVLAQVNSVYGDGLCPAPS